MAHQTTRVVAEDDGVPPAMDYKEHERTYKGFMIATKWSVIATAVLIVLLYFLIRP
jgi:hypothetical protein